MITFDDLRRLDESRRSIAQRYSAQILDDAPALTACREDVLLIKASEWLQLMKLEMPTALDNDKLVALLAAIAQVFIERAAFGAILSLSNVDNHIEMSEAATRREYEEWRRRFSEWCHEE